jgi:DNA invertase Pin-like site-specific DNA recombinase
MDANQREHPTTSKDAADGPKAYSYVRFSTPEQAQGNSYHRQTERAKEYARLHVLKLAELTFNDLGVSAYKSKNARTGALRAFLDMVENGAIEEGSYLLLENLDRLTRDDIVPAQGLFLQIIGAGINLVTLTDERVYSRQSINANPTDLIISIVHMMRANQESARKADLLFRAYETKRQIAATGAPQDKPFTRMLPAWLTWNEDARRTPRSSATIQTWRCFPPTTGPVQCALLTMLAIAAVQTSHAQPIRR